MCSSPSSLLTLLFAQSPDGPRHSHPPHPGGRRLPGLRLPQSRPLRQRRAVRGLAEVLGRPRGLLPPGAARRPPDQPTELLLPRLLDTQVLLPSLVHGPGQVERQRPPLQPGEIRSWTPGWNSIKPIKPLNS